MPVLKHFLDPELLPIEGSEIEAAVDITVQGVDKISRPVFIAQSNGDMLQLTLSDAIRLQKFLSGAIPFIEDYVNRTLQ